MRFVVPVLIAFLGMGCFLNACGDNRHDVAGPGIDVHCNALAPNAGNGDTSVKVTCPPAAEGLQ